MACVHEQSDFNKEIVLAADSFYQGLSEIHIRVPITVNSFKLKSSRCRIPLLDGERGGPIAGNWKPSKCIF